MKQSSTNTAVCGWTLLARCGVLSRAGPGCWTGPGCSHQGIPWKPPQRVDGQYCRPGTPLGLPASA
jgi:hypothetical protein